MTTATDVVLNLLAGGLLGLLGQGIRMAIGLKKNADNAMMKPTEQQTVNLSRLGLSLFIGFVAGALYVLVNDKNYQSNEFIFAVMAAGYAGADFIEGLFNTALNKFTPPAQATDTSTVTNASTATTTTTTTTTATPNGAQQNHEAPQVNPATAADSPNPLVIAEESNNPKTVG